MSFNSTETSGSRESSITAATRTSADWACSSMIPDQVLGKLFPRAFLIGERLENKRRAAAATWMSHWPLAENRAVMRSLMVNFHFYFVIYFIIASFKQTPFCYSDQIHLIFKLYFCSFLIFFFIVFLTYRWCIQSFRGFKRPQMSKWCWRHSSIWRTWPQSCVLLQFVHMMGNPTNATLKSRVSATSHASVRENHLFCTPHGSWWDLRVFHFVIQWSYFVDNDLWYVSSVSFPFQLHWKHLSGGFLNKRWRSSSCCFGWKNQTWSMRLEQ